MVKERKDGTSESSREKTTKWDPKAELNAVAEDFRRDIIEPIERWWRRNAPMSAGRPPARSPRLEVEDLGDEYEVVAELPGIAKDQVRLSTTSGVLEIDASASSREIVSTERGRRETKTATGFYRAFSLPADANPDKVEATMRDGVLRVRMGKLAGPRDGRKRVPID